MQLYNLVTFANGSKTIFEKLLQSVAISKYFSQIISVEELQTFKPDLEVYQLLLDKTAVRHGNCWLVSSNSFDIIGAGALGINTIWLKRDANNIFDPCHKTKPTGTISNLIELKGEIKKDA